MNIDKYKTVNDELNSVEACIDYALRSKIDRFEKSIGNFRIRMFRNNIIHDEIRMLLDEDIPMEIDEDADEFTFGSKDFMKCINNIANPSGFSNFVELNFSITADKETLNKCSFKAYSNEMNGEYVSVDGSKLDTDMDFAKKMADDIFERMFVKE